MYINGKPIEEIESEYGISKSTFYGSPRKYREKHDHIHKGLKDRVAAEHDIKLLCRVLKVPWSTYYATINRP